MPAPSPVKSLVGTLKMLDGRTIPQFGLGVYEMNDADTYSATKGALEAGYKHIDTAEWYENEGQVGRALTDFCKSSGAKREDIYITSKLMHNRGYDAALRDLKASLGRAGLDYFDLYLLHSPIGGPDSRKELWRALVDAKKAGLCKSIGVSNYGAKHIQEMVDAGVELPVVNQIDLHPFMRHPDIVELCEKHDILLEAWAPLARATKFDNSVIVKMAAKYNREPAQIFLRWGLQHGYVIIPKSVSQKRIESNANIFDFEISDEDIKELDGLDEYHITDWDVVGVE
ncbi:uncharacterized protein EHS24_002190 [Apiotrichum porosum]|uniref:NADP-dependent oxidoreductase domain-containing protein n=1 Tax=Apiotrichum porosum TaxID=105984 RepID=A0A427XHW5_9TREE|nr:uncharacterized protein EHS24_002190 [Apiotrichum porosum]RSH78465.1 hypothetical protein EHS24_002190 [Apiotrichum porosum]